MSKSLTPDSTNVGAVELSPNEDQVVARLQKIDEDKNWVSELVCILFNSQGEALYIVRGNSDIVKVQSDHKSRGEFKNPSMSKYGGFDSYSSKKSSELLGSNSNTSNISAIQEFTDGNIVLTRRTAKEATEKENLIFKLSSLSPYIDAVAILITTSVDEIASLMPMNAFHFTLSLTDDNAFGSSELQHLGSTANVSISPIFSESYIPPTKPVTLARSEKEMQTNFMVACKFFRSRRTPKMWIFHPIWKLHPVRSSVGSSLVQATQDFLLDIIPDISIPNQNALNSVMSICSALSRSEFEGIEQYFPERGVSKIDFARILLYEFLKTKPELRHISRAAAFVALSFEMFEQIDINSDELVDWEEFTTFCVSLGLIATNEAMSLFDPQQSSYKQVTPKVESQYFPYQVRQIKAFSQLRRIAVIGRKSLIVLMFDQDMELQNEINNVQKLNNRQVEMELLDIEHVSNKNSLAISASDNSIMIWSIVDITIGSYVLSQKLHSRFAVTLLRWFPSICKLVACGGESFAQFWDLDLKRVSGRFEYHQDRLTDIIAVPKSSYFATSSYDHTIAIWCSQSMSIQFTLVGHIQGIRHLDAVPEILVSAGFEHQAYVWDLNTRQLITTMGGHHHSLMGVKFVSVNTNAGMQAPAIPVVTGDEGGNFKLWDILSAIKDASQLHVTPCLLQCFEVRGVIFATRFRFFTLGVFPEQHKKRGEQQGLNIISSNLKYGMEVNNCGLETRECDKTTNGDFLDIITGTTKLFRFHAVSISNSDAPPQYVLYNSASNVIVAAVDGRITVWNANTGAKLEEPIHIREGEICGLAFDLPRQRKLYVAMNDGDIRIYNPITGALLSKNHIHDGIISTMQFCPGTRCLISTGYDRCINIMYSYTEPTAIEILRRVENAHEACITTCAVDVYNNLVVTGDDTGSIHVYDFQRMYLKFRCVAHQQEISALHLQPSNFLLFSGDINGFIYAWDIRGPEMVYIATPIMNLTKNTDSLPSSNSSLEVNDHINTGTQSTNFPSNDLDECEDNISRVSAIFTAIGGAGDSLAVYAAWSTGKIEVWEYEALHSVAIDQHTKKLFDINSLQLLQNSDPWRIPSYNYKLRTYHKSSVLKLCSNDIEGTSPQKSQDNAIAGFSVELENLIEGTKSQSLLTTEIKYMIQNTKCCMATSSWQAHEDSISILKGLPSPGMLYSVSLDCTIKIWDTNCELMGIISTLSDKDTMIESTGPTSRQVNQKSAQLRNIASGSFIHDESSKWKFSRRGTAEAEIEHQRIAEEVIRAHNQLFHGNYGEGKHYPNRQQLIHQNDKITNLNSQGINPQYLDSIVDINEKTNLNYDNKDACQNTENQVACDSSEACISADPFHEKFSFLKRSTAFSSLSLRSGTLQGLFGPYEIGKLQTIASTTNAESKLSKSHSKLPKLSTFEDFDGSEQTSIILNRIELHRFAMANARAVRRMSTTKRPDQSGRDGAGIYGDSDVMKTITNFPLELKRRKGKRMLKLKEALAAKHEIGLSPFLSEKLGSVEMSPPFTSPNRNRVKMHHNQKEKACLSRLPSIHKDQHIPFQANSTPVPSKLFKDAANCFSTANLLSVENTQNKTLRASASEPVISHQSSNLGVIDTQGIDVQSSKKDPEKVLVIRSEIERKMKVYENTILYSHRLSKQAAEKHKLKTPMRKEKQSNPITPNVPEKHDTRPNTENNFGPHYSQKDVLEIAIVLSQIDANFSGAIDEMEWIELLQGSRPQLSLQEIENAKKLFHTMDKDDSGHVGITEVLPVVFPQATSNQIKRMVAYIESCIKDRSKWSPPATTSTRGDTPQKSQT